MLRYMLIGVTNVFPKKANGKKQLVVHKITIGLGEMNMSPKNAIARKQG